VSAEGGTLGIARGAALYVGALVGPGLLLVPALALDAAGPASIIAWLGLLVLSVPLAVTFALLGIRHPVAAGVAQYVREGFGERAAAVTGACFITAVVLGAPAVSLIGGYYVADLTGQGRTLAGLVGLAMFAVVLTANAFGLRVSSACQLGLYSLLVVVILTAVAAALPAHAGQHWRPFAPHGWWADGAAASILMWLFIGWEAMAQLAGEFRRPSYELPRAMALAFAVIAVLYVALAVATISAGIGDSSKVPLADLLVVGFGPPGRDAAAVLAVLLTMGTMNVYTAGSARLAAALARDSVLPAWLGGDAHRRVPRRPLLALGALGSTILVALLLGVGSTTDLVRATSACFVAVYVLALGSAVRILSGTYRVTAALALVLMSVVAVFSGRFVLVPVAAGLVLATGRLLGRRRGHSGRRHPDSPAGPAGRGRLQVEDRTIARSDAG
jgi:amino acid efflux transporter